MAAIMIMGAPAAIAGVSVAMTPSFPPSLKVGLINQVARLVLTNSNFDPPNANNPDTVQNVTLTPQCGSATPAGTCPAGFEESTKDVILIHTGAGAATADAGCGAAGPVTVNPPAVTGGPYSFVGTFTVQKGTVCNISFTYDVVGTPTKDSDAAMSGMQTTAQAGAVVNDAILGTPGSGRGTVPISFPTISTVPSAGGPAPKNLSDTATILGLNPPSNNPAGNPTGTVTFSLYAPSDATCTGAPFQTQVVNLTSCTFSPVTLDATCQTTNTFTANAAGTWHWTGLYTPAATPVGDNVSLFSPCTAEPVNITPPTAITTTPVPAVGKFGTALNDTAVLTGGTAPYTGTITFNLYDPDQPACTGTPRYTQIVTVTNGGANNGATSPGFLPDKAGTWRWTANYSGDGLNGPAASGCTLEPVDVLPPVLTISKTPDGTTYTAGSEISFTILITNTGPGIANNVRLSPADVLPDPNNSLSWSVKSVTQVPLASTQTPPGSATPCTVSALPGPQSLSCNFGNLAEGATATVVVSSLTQSADVGDCGNPLILNNSATVIADNATAKTDIGSVRCSTTPAPVTTTPVPSNGKVDGPALNDTATLAGTPPFAGSITFNLYDPTSPTCTGAPRFTQTVAVTTAGTAATTGGPVPNMSGTWNWTAVYTGDANHTAATSACGQEPVIIVNPIITVVKTPDAQNYAPGSPISFTITVTNQGAGTAQQVKFQPLDRLPDPNSSLNWSITTQPSSGTCVITGAAGAQDLACDFGNIPELQSRTVTVTTATQAADLGDCPLTPGLVNNVTVVSTNAPTVTDTGSLLCPKTPLLRIVKDPDNKVYLPGDPVSFTITVSNISAPGAPDATNVRFAPADVLPDPNASLNWSITTNPTRGTCTLTGAIGSQALNCNFGSMPTGESLIVVVTSQTSASDPGDCGKPLILSNTVTVVSDNAGSQTDTGSYVCDSPTKPVPTLSQWSLLLLMILSLATGCAVLRRRHL